MKVFGNLSKVFTDHKIAIVSSMMCASIVLSGIYIKTEAVLTDSTTVGVSDSAEIWIVPSVNPAAFDFQSVNVSWAKTGSYSAYTLQYSTASNFSTFTSVAVNGLTTKVSGLTSNTTYYFRVKPTSSPTGTWKTASVLVPAWAPKKVGTGWGNYIVGAAGDLDQDPTLPGARDFVAADQNGVLWLYPGYNQGAVSSTRRSQIGTGFGNMIAFWSAGDWNNDGREDLMAGDVNGLVFLYTAKKPFNATAPYNAPIQIGGTSLTMYSIVGLGDVTGDGKPDLGTWDSAGTMRIYPGNGTATLGTPFVVGGGWAQYVQAYPIGDLNNDGHNDMIAINSLGQAWFYAGTGASNNTAFKPAVKVPNMTLYPSTDWYYMGPGDMDADGVDDFMEVSSVGDMFFWKGTDIKTALGL